jgi:hypothetical protein
VHLDRGVKVLRDRLGADAPYFDEGLAAQKSGRAAPKDAVAAVLSRTDDLEEQALLVTADLVMLDGVVV